MSNTIATVIWTIIDKAIWLIAALGITGWVILAFHPRERSPLDGSMRFYVFLVSSGCLAIAIGKLANEVYRRRIVFRRLAHVSKQEKRLLAFAVRSGQQTLFLSIRDVATVALVEKGLMVMAKQHEELPSNCPFTVPDYVWSYIRSRKAQFAIGDAEYQAMLMEMEQAIDGNGFPEETS